MGLAPKLLLLPVLVCNSLLLLFWEILKLGLGTSLMRTLMVTPPPCLDSLLKKPFYGTDSIPLPPNMLWLFVDLEVCSVEPLPSLPVLPLPSVLLPSLSEQSQCVV